MIDSANPVTVTSHCHGVKYGFKLEGRTGPEPNRSDRACPGNMISERGWSAVATVTGWSNV